MTLGILQHYFAHTKTLATHLKESLSAPIGSQPLGPFVSETDESIFRNLLETTIVATQTSNDSISWSPHPHMGMKDVCNFLNHWREIRTNVMKDYREISGATLVPKDSNSHHYSRILSRDRCFFVSFESY